MLFFLTNISFLHFLLWVILYICHLFLATNTVHFINTIIFPLRTSLSQQFLHILLHLHFLSKSICPHQSSQYPWIQSHLTFHQSLFKSCIIIFRDFLSTCFVDGIDSSVPSESVYKLIGILFQYYLYSSIFICLAANTSSSINLFSIKASASLEVG